MRICTRGKSTCAANPSTSPFIRTHHSIFKTNVVRSDEERKPSALGGGFSVPIGFLIILQKSLNRNDTL